MFAKTIAFAAVTAFVAATEAAKEAPVTKADEGFMAGAMKGLMLTNEHEMKGCQKPHVPDMVKQAETMLPMLDMMAKQMNNGKEPTWMTQLKESEHTLALFAAMTLEQYPGTEFCRGMIMAFEGRKLAMVVAGQAFTAASAALF